MSMWQYGGDGMIINSTTTVIGGEFDGFITPLMMLNLILPKMTLTCDGEDI